MPAYLLAPYYSCKAAVNASAEAPYSQLVPLINGNTLVGVGISEWPPMTPPLTAPDIVNLEVPARDGGIESTVSLQPRGRQKLSGSIAWPEREAILSLAEE